MSQGTRPLRVLLIAPSLAITGGQSVQAAKLLSVLQQLPSLEMRFFPIDPALPRWLQWARKVKFLRTIVMSVFYYAGLLGRVPRSDLLHVFTAGLSSYALWTIPALVASKVFGKKFVMHYHDGQAEQHLASWRIASPTIRQADRLIVPSRFLVDVFARHQIPAAVISNIVEVDRFPFRRRERLRPAFLSNRMLEPLYNIPCILRAFAIVQAKFPDASLVIAHDGYLRPNLEGSVHELGLNNVKFIGRVPFEQIPAVYDAADIYLTTPNIDNMPGSILECFACGLPIVATKAGGIPYIAIDRETALLVELDDHDAVAAAAIELLENPDLASNLALRGREEVQKYHWQPVRDQWAALYFDTVRGKTARSGV